MNVGRILAVAALIGVVNGLAVAAPFAWRWLKLREPSAPAAVEVVVKDTLSHYAIRGSTAEELKREMARKGPARYWASTRYFIEPVYKETVLPDGRCAMAMGKVSFDVTIRMPKLGVFHGAPACLESRFETLYSRLLEHEMEHRSIGLDAAKAYAKAMDGIGPQSTCDALEAKAYEVLRGIVREYDYMQSRFDRNTDHGMKGGALVLEDC